jgi:hypothetical protein
MAFLGETFVKAGGSSVDLAYVTQAKIIIVMYTAGRPISDAHVARYSQLMVLNYLHCISLATNHSKLCNPNPPLVATNFLHTRAHLRHCTIYSPGICRGLLIPLRLVTWV